MLVLRALSLGALHGYGIVQRIRQLSDDLLTVEQGSLYPALYRMEQRGWIKSKWGTNETGRRAKFYRLSNAGSKQLATLVGRFADDRVRIGRDQNLVLPSVDRSALADLYAALAASGLAEPGIG